MPVRTFWDSNSLKIPHGLLVRPNRNHRRYSHLEAMYLFNEGGGNVAHDLCGYHHLTFNPAAPPSWNGLGVVCNGSNQWAKCFLGHGDSGSTAERLWRYCDVTVVVDCLVTSLGDWDNIFGVHTADYAPYNSYVIGVGPNRRFACYWNNISMQGGESAVDSNNYGRAHLVFSCGTGSQKLWLNGVEIYSNNQSPVLGYVDFESYVIIGAGSPNVVYLRAEIHSRNFTLTDVIENWKNPYGTTGDPCLIFGCREVWSPTPTSNPSYRRGDMNPFFGF